MQQDGGSSVEEILESIKKVIARDSQANAMIEERKSLDKGDSDHGSTAHDDGGAAISEHPLEPAYDDEAEEILDLGTANMVDEDDVAHKEFDEGDRHRSDYHDGGNHHSDDDTPLINSAARNSMRDNLAALAMLAEPGVPPQIVRTGETSLEGLARDLLRPMLAEWLDANLPDMVETMVKAEIARIGGKRG